MYYPEIIAPLADQISLQMKGVFISSHMAQPQVYSLSWVNNKKEIDSENILEMVLIAGKSDILSSSPNQIQKISIYCK